MRTILSSVLGFLAGGLVAVFAEPFRQWLFRPTLALEFENRPDCVARTPEGTSNSWHEALYLRAKVVNSSRRLAKSCRAYLVKVERRDPSGVFQPTLYCESHQLSWSSTSRQQQFSALDIPCGVAQYVDVVSTRAIAANFELSIEVVPFRYNHIFDELGTYRFTVRVAGDGVKPASVTIQVTSTDRWDGFEASSV